MTVEITIKNAPTQQKYKSNIKTYTVWTLEQLVSLVSEVPHSCIYRSFHNISKTLHNNSKT